jgi:hypothetical protein
LADEEVCIGERYRIGGALSRSRSPASLVIASDPHGGNANDGPTPTCYLLFATTGYPVRLMWAYTVSASNVKLTGIASSFLHSQIGVGDVLEVATPRGSFTLRQDSGPVALLSAGIGVTSLIAGTLVESETIVVSARRRRPHEQPEDSAVHC